MNSASVNNVTHLIIDFLSHEIVERRHRVQHGHVVVLLQKGLFLLAIPQEHENSVRNIVCVCAKNSIGIMYIAWKEK